MADNPRLLVIDREASPGKTTLEKLGEAFDVVTVHSISKAISLLRDTQFSGVYVDASQLSAVRWVGMIIQAEEILDAIADGVAVVDPDLRIIWANPEFLSLTDSPSQVTGGKFYQVLADSEVLGPGPCPFTSAVASQGPASTVMKIRGNRYLRVTVTPVFDVTHTLTHLIALTREITDETQQQLKVNAIAQAGDELADLTPEELSQLGVEERTDLLKYNIVRHMKDLMGLDYIEIRLLEKATDKLIPLLSEGMSPLSATRELMVRKGGARRDRVCRRDRSELRLPRHDQGPALHRGRETAQLPDRATRLSWHGRRHAQRRESPAEQLRRSGPPVSGDLRPQHCRGAEHAGIAPG